MISQPNRIYLAGGVLVGALAIAAYGLRGYTDQLAAGRMFGRDDISLSMPSDNAPTRPVRAQPDIDSTSDAGIAYVLRAVHDSLQRNDLASAKVLLDAVLAIRADDQQALLLQKELRAREETARAAAVAVNADTSPKTAEPAAAAAHSVTRADRTRERSLRSSHGQTIVASRHTGAQGAQSQSKNEAVSNQAMSADALKMPQGVGAASLTVASAPAIQAAPVTPAPVEHSAPPVQAEASSVAQSNTQITAQTATPPVQTAQSSPAPVVASQAPKTRAEVREELNRARASGAMSRFGNPDPYGPGGSPSHNAQPTVRAW